ncbi:hypothetical protein PSAC2689_80327 [Paraburkholderia sacchari]
MNKQHCCRCFITSPHIDPSVAGMCLSGAVSLPGGPLDDENRCYASRFAMSGRFSRFGTVFAFSS